MVGVEPFAFVEHLDHELGGMDARRQLEAYFAGRLEVFDLPLALDGTPFQVKVWRAVAEIPYGQTRAYGDVARRIRRPNAVRIDGWAAIIVVA